MKVLVVYAHPNPESFNHAVAGAFVQGLTDAGHEYEIVDLYRDKFDPIIDVDDLVQFSGGQMPEDVLDQQRKVSAADALALIGPIHGWTLPAILKGWIDRVFSHGFAYEVDDTGEVRGLLTHQKALIIVTMGFPEQVFKASGAEDALRKVYLELTFELMGVQRGELAALYAVEAIGEEGRKMYLERVRKLGRDF